MNSILFLSTLQDLCMHTPDSHPDYRILKESLHTMSDFIASTHDPQSFRQVHTYIHEWA